MNKATIVFKKELKDTLRDKRSIIFMIAVPLLVFPVLISIASGMILTQAKKAQEKTLQIGLIAQGNAPEFRQELLAGKNLNIQENIGEDQGMTLVREDKLDALIVFDREFDKKVEELSQGSIKLYMKITEEKEIEKTRVLKLLSEFEDKLREKRFREMDLDASIIKTLKINEQNLATAKEQIAVAVGGFLPYLFIIFCFMGSMYPAIDLAAGEKERGTLETLLTSPVDRFQILIGKLGVVMLAGITSALVAMLGMYIGIRRMADIPPELLDTVMSILEVKSILVLLSLLIPLTIFFAALLLSLSIFARSYKEAQSILSPMMFVVIIPAFMGLLPGVKLTMLTALIPILNVSLATKAIIAESITTPQLVAVYLSLILLAAISIYVCSKIYGRESAIFR
ncbi:MAG: ABC transporter permease [Candidatus Aminicenantes bacterium]|nr:ABC transporter permease [Candidatus Aminicenantes bacterium]